MNELRKCLKESFQNQTTEMLKEMTILLMADTREGADTTFNYVTAELANRMPEKEFNEFCESL